MMTSQQRIVLIPLAFLVIVVGVYAFTFGEFGLFNKNSSSDQDKISAAQEAVTSVMPTESLMDSLAESGSLTDSGEVKSEGIDNSDLDAQSSGESQYFGEPMICTYSDEDIDLTLKISGNKMRVDTIGKEDSAQTGGVIIKNGMTYAWSTENKMGVVIAQEAGEEGDTAESLAGSLGFAEGEIEANMEEYKQNCKEQAVSDSVFELPSDIEFIDLGDGLDMSKMEELMKLGQ